ncbi:hypothetical protein JOQ06_019828, partial [Pogonophryne albipinna]
CFSSLCLAHCILLTVYSRYTIVVQESKVFPCLLLFYCCPFTPSLFPSWLIKSEERRVNEAVIECDVC